MAKRILIVDDEESLVALIIPMLMASGFEVITANDGEKGLRAAREEKPDLIILDIMLPKMDGYEICRLLKFDIDYAHIPIILLTARASEKDREISAEVKADAYITKPYEPDVLLGEIKKLLAGGK